MNNKNKKFTPFLSMVFVLLMVNYLFPVEVKKIEIHRFEEFQQGELKGVSLDNKGRLFIGPDVKTVAGPSGEYYLSLDMASNGDIYVGTGHKAAVYKIKSTSAVANPQANPVPAEEIFTSDALDSHALLVKSNGDVFVGTSPEGKVYKISPTAKDSKDKGYKEFFNPEEKFIWDLKEDKEGNIICAVGNNGGIYRITPDGQSSKIFASEDTHIISLYITSGNSILAGSGDRGTLYRIDNRKVKVLYDSSLEEVRGICEDKNGNIYFSAGKGISRQDTEKTPADVALKKKENQKEEKIEEKSILFCLRTDGIVETLWKSKTETIYAVVYDEKNDSVLIGTGDSGRLYRVKKDGSFSIVYESDSAQVFKIVSGNKGFTLITNNTATIAQVEETLNNKGSYYSDVYDLRIPSRLGRLYWEADSTLQTEVSMFIRTGNTKIPDNTWSQWSAPFSDSENSLVNISDCRYFQLKALLNSKNGSDTPYLHSIKIYYIQSNLNPQVKRIEIQGPAPKISIITDKTKTGPLTGKTSKNIVINWEAMDPNNDKLKYNVYIKKYTAANWILIKEDITEPKIELEMELFQDGKYLLKVDADDSLSNPPLSMKSSSLVSASFLIDSTPPVIGNFSAAASHLRFNVQDQTSVISKVSYSFDGKHWFPVFPVDGVNDSKSESYDVDMKNMSGKKFIFLKAQDEYENSSVFQSEF